jgi:hypothetical protein
MFPRRRRKKSFYALSTELALAIPQVMTHRLLRMAAAGGKPSLRDQREFDRMITEKAAAFSDSWADMAAKSFEVNQKLALSFMRSWLTHSPSGVHHTKQLQRAALNVLAAGMAPVHRRATANARRLNKVKRRRRT